MWKRLPVFEKERNVTPLGVAKPPTAKMGGKVIFIFKRDDQAGS